MAKFYSVYFGWNKYNIDIFDNVIKEQLKNKQTCDYFILK